MERLEGWWGGEAVWGCWEAVTQVVSLVGPVLLVGGMVVGGDYGDSPLLDQLLLVVVVVMVERGLWSVLLHVRHRNRVVGL